jgi:nucleotide-binding universal stress UspA family protein
MTGLTVRPDPYRFQTGENMSGIIVGIDGSGHSQAALDWAVREAGVHQAPLTVLTVHEVAASGWGGTMVYQADDAIREENRKAAQEAVDQAVQKAAGPVPTEVTVRAVSGTPAEALVEASRDADLLVVGSRGAGGFARLLLGSVSTEVSHHAACPIVIVPSGGRQ